VGVASLVGAPHEHFFTAIRHHAPPAALVTFAFALLAYRLRAVDLSGTISGAVLSFVLYATSGPGAFATLAAVFVVTAGTTHIGQEQKRALGIAERKQGRNGCQVLANLAAAAALSAASLYASRPGLLLAAVAALAEAAADTASSEIGKARGFKAYLVTSFRRVDVGEDGAISVVGTAGGIAAGLFVALTAHWCRLIPSHWIAATAGAAALGMFIDSFLGATLQRRGWLSNSGVNLVSTVAAAAIALAFLL
jgi:uncharacterized protein (TIGR00297 family)